MTTVALQFRTLSLALLLVPAASLAQYGAPPPGPPPGYQPVQAYGAPSQRAGPAAHRFELVGLAGYHIASDFSFVSGHATIDSSVSYGAALRFAQAPGQYAELSWVWAPTNATYHSNAINGGLGTSSLNIHYIQIGGTKGFRNGNLEPYIGLSMGSAIFAVGDLRAGGSAVYGGSTAWRFGFTVGGGLKVWLSDAVALQVDARMLAPVWFSSASFYAGGGGGAFAVSGGIPIVEGNFTGGIVIAP